MTKSSKLLVPGAVIVMITALLLIFALPGPSTPPPLIPRTILFGHPVKTNPRLSPDGSQIAFLAPDHRDVLNVWVAPIDNLSEARPITSEPKRGIRSYFWQWDGKGILYTQDVDGNEDWHLYQTRLDTKVTRDLTPFSSVRAAIVGYHQDHPNEILVALNLRDPTLFDVHRIALDSGAITLDTTNPGDVTGWVADHNLQVRSAQAYTPDGGIIIRVRDDVQTPWRDLIAWGPEEGAGGAEAFTADGTSLYVLSSLDNDTVRLLKIDNTTAQQKVIAQDPSYDLEDILIHPTTHHLQAVGVERDRYGWIILDKGIKNDFQTLEKLAGPAFQIVSRTRDDTKWIVSARRDDSPTTFYLYDRSSKHAKELFTTLPELKDYTLVPMQPVKITARDGLQLEGYLTLPAGRKAKELPTILYVHGGPWVRDTWGFNPVVQWLANRGYAVLQINYRGSSGYGKAFYNAGDKEWGAKMHDDLLDAKNWLVERGIAPADKVAVYGGSYGGYATLVGLAFTPEEFCCGIDVVGPSNLLTLLNSLPPYWESARAHFNRRVGDIVLEEELMKDRSPHIKAQQINRPLLIAQGSHDPRVKQHESDQIVSAMRQQDKPVEYLVFPDEGHGFAQPQNRLRFYAAAEHFLAEHLGGSEQPPTPQEEWEPLRH